MPTATPDHDSPPPVPILPYATPEAQAASRPMVLRGTFLAFFGVVYGLLGGAMLLGQLKGNDGSLLVIGLGCICASVYLFRTARDRFVGIKR